MKNYIKIIVPLSLLFFAISGLAQPELSGYYENTFQGIYTEDTDELILNASKIRLDINAGGNDEELEFRGNINFIQYHSSVNYDISPFLPDAVAQQLPLTTVTLDQSRIYLDNAFLTWSNNNLRFRAGKQQLSWGTGYSINPTDLFHKKNVIDPTYEKEGVTALRLDYRWGVGGQATIIAAPQEKFDETGYAMRLGTHVSAIGYDAAITLHQVVDSTSVSPVNYSQITQTRQAVGFEFSGSIFGPGVWFEGNINFMEKEDDFFRGAFGIDYTLENGLYMMAEVLVNTRSEDSTPYPVEDWMSNVLYGEPVGSGWTLLGIRHDISSLTSGSLYAFISNDGSMMFNPRLTISIAQNADATIFGGYSIGDDEGAFPPGLVNGFARVSVFF